MKRPEIKFFLISILLHAGLAALIFLPLQKADSTRWSGGNDQAIEMAPVFVSLQNDFMNSGRTSPHQQKKILPKKNPTHRAQSPHMKPKKFLSESNFNKSGSGNSDTPGHGQGDGLDKNGTPTTEATSVLAKIRKAIMRRQFYPPEARAQKLSGSVKVHFKILKNGGLDHVRVLKGSGHSVLDEAALATIKKATPLPYYPESIALSLDYQLK